VHADAAHTDGLHHVKSATEELQSEAEELDLAGGGEGVAQLEPAGGGMGGGGRGGGRKEVAVEGSNPSWHRGRRREERPAVGRDLHMPFASRLVRERGKN
jgi:hypothetical protein